MKSCHTFFATTQKFVSEYSNVDFSIVNFASLKTKETEQKNPPYSKPSNGNNGEFYSLFGF